VAHKGEEILGDLGERRLVLEEVGGEPVHLEGRGRHVAFGIDVAMEGLAGWDAVEQLDAADLHHPIAREWIEAGGFRIEHDFAHFGLYLWSMIFSENRFPLFGIMLRSENHAAGPA